MSTRVRFAPSPTGLLHVGNIRAALINWLFARKTGGDFLLRLDDTDGERSTEAFADGIREDLSWLGLTWDEEARQSDRFDRYDAVAAELKASGQLYRCFETAEELEMKRRMQMSRGKPPVYDRAALALSADQIAAFEAEGRAAHWRFKLDLPAKIHWKDRIRGSQTIDLTSVSDPILIRGNGSYLYTLPSVIDDIDFAITHIVRGEDHVTNSAVQVQIFEALGAKVPEMAHFSLLTSVEGEGLSKRLGSASIQAMREEAGLEAMSVVSLLAHLGTSKPIAAFSEVGPLVDDFDFSAFGRAAAKFDPRELERLNAQILHGTPYSAVSGRIGVSEAVWNVVRANIKTMNELDDWQHIIEGPIKPIIEDEAFMREAASLFPEGNIDGDTWSAWTAAVKAATGAKGKSLFMPLRLALTGRGHGPEMKALLPLIGADKVRRRLGGEEV